MKNEKEKEKVTMLMSIFGVIFGLYVLITEPDIPLIFEMLYISFFVTDVFIAIVNHHIDKVYGRRKRDER